MNRACRPIAISLLAITVASCSAQPQPASSPTSPALGPAALGDGGRVAVALRAGNGSDIVTMDPDGSHVQQLTDDPAFDACPDIGPSGTLIAFCSDRSGAFEVWLMDADGKNQRRLTTLNGDSTFVAISPDESRVAFCGSTGSPDDNHDIWLINVDGTGLAQLTNSPEQDDCHPVWSPDGSSILFTSARGGLGAQLWLIMANGREEHEIPTGQNAGLDPPDWSPDGNAITYIQDGSVYVMAADGTGVRRLTQKPGIDYAPAWSPQGNEIVYRHLENEIGSLRIVSVQSGQSRSVPFTQQGLPLAPDWHTMVS